MLEVAHMHYPESQKKTEYEIKEDFLASCN